MTPTILCIKWGTKYGSQYVNRLFSGARRHLSGKFRFVCLTDDSHGIERGVEVFPLPQTGFDEAAFDARKGGDTWRKVGLFQPGLADLQSETLFLDLDIVITGSLDELFTYEPGKFCVIHDWLERRRAWMPGRDGRVGNTSVFRFHPQRHQLAYTYFAEHQSEVLQSFRIEQQYISRVLKDDLAFWPDEWVSSFKRYCRPTFPLNHFCTPRQPASTKVLVFHGFPLPDQAIAGYRGGWIKSTLPAPWVAQNWLTEAELAQGSQPETTPLKKSA